MFVVEAGSLLTTALWVQAVLGQGEAPAGFIGAVALWLWFTVLFANFAEAVAEGRGKAQARPCAARDKPRRPRSCMPLAAKPASRRSPRSACARGLGPGRTERHPGSGRGNRRRIASVDERRHRGERSGHREAVEIAAPLPAAPACSRTG